MNLKSVLELIQKEIRDSCYLDILRFLEQNNLKTIMVKDLVKEIEKNYSTELIVDIKNTEIYSYELVYSYCKLKLFNSLDTGKDIDLRSDEFNAFNPEDLIRIFCFIYSEFFEHLLEYF